MVGERLEELRVARGWTQMQLAERAGLTDSAISMIENGVRWPRQDTLRKLATALGCEVADLLQVPSTPLSGTAAVGAP